MGAHTSLSSYRALVLTGKATSQRNQILTCLYESAVPVSRRQIKEMTGLEINAVCGRVNTLLKSNLIRVAFEKRDLRTDKVVEFLEPALELEQGELWR